MAKKIIRKKSKRILKLADGTADLGATNPTSPQATDQNAITPTPTPPTTGPLASVANGTSAVMPSQAVQPGQQPYRAGSIDDPKTSAIFMAPGSPKLLTPAPTLDSIARAPLPQLQTPTLSGASRLPAKTSGLNLADGAAQIPETPDQVSARIAAKYGVSGAAQPAPAPAPAPQPAPEPTQVAQKPGLLATIFNRGQQLRAAADYAEGGIVSGRGGPTDDQVPMTVGGRKVNLSNREAVLPVKTVNALGGPKTIAQLIEMTNGKPPVKGGLKAGGNYADGSTNEDPEELMQRIAQTRGIDYVPPAAPATPAAPPAAPSEPAQPQNSEMATQAQNDQRNLLKGVAMGADALALPGRSLTDAAGGILNGVARGVNAVAGKPIITNRYESGISKYGAMPFTNMVGDNAEQAAPAAPAPAVGVDDKPAARGQNLAPTLASIANSPPGTIQQTPRLTLASIANDQGTRDNLNAQHAASGDGFSYGTTTGANGKPQVMLTGGPATKPQYIDAGGNPTNDWTKTQQYSDAVSRSEKDSKALQGHFLRAVASGDIDGAMRTAISPQDQAMAGTLVKDSKEGAYRQATNDAALAHLPPELRALKQLEITGKEQPGEILAKLASAGGLPAIAPDQAAAQQAKQLANLGAQLDINGKKLTVTQQQQLTNLQAQIQSEQDPAKKMSLLQSYAAITGKYPDIKMGELGGGQITDPNTGMPITQPKGAVVASNGVLPANVSVIGGPTSASAQPTPPRVGEVRSGYKFKGGDPSKQASWERV